MLRNPSTDSFRDVFNATWSARTGALSARTATGIGGVLSDLATTLPPYIAVASTTTIAQVVERMIDCKAKRVLIRRSDGANIGVVRATDIMALLLREQHVSYGSAS